MPSFFSFLRAILLIVVLFYGVLYALDVFVSPEQRTISVRVPSSTFNQPE